MVSCYTNTHATLVFFFLASESLEIGWNPVKGQVGWDALPTHTLYYVSDPILLNQTPKETQLKDPLAKCLVVTWENGVRSTEQMASSTSDCQSEPASRREWAVGNTGLAGGSAARAMGKQQPHLCYWGGQVWMQVQGTDCWLRGEVVVKIYLK